MAHCPPELLDDLADVFAEIRGWPGMTEKRRGVFYVRRAPFLHFHRQADGRRRADVKGLGGWVPVDLPYPVPAGRQRAFVRDLRRHYATTQRSALSTPGARTPSRRTAASFPDCARDGARRPGS